MGLALQKRAVIQDLRARTRGYAGSRIRKIFPLYIIATLLAFFISPLFGRPLPQLDRLWLDILLLPHVEGGRFVDPIIGAGWTLRYEIFFYAVVFIGLLINSRHFVTGVMVAVAFGFPVALGYYNNLLLLEFLAGYLLAAKLDGLPGLASLPLRLIGLLVAIAFFLLAATGVDFPPVGQDLARIPRMLVYFGNQPMLRVIVWGIPAFLLVLATASLEPYIPQCLARLGKYSYSMYIMQYFCLPIQHKLLKLGWSEMLSLSTTLLVLAVVTALSYVYIERPLSAGGAKWLPKLLMGRLNALPTRLRILMPRTVWGK